MRLHDTHCHLDLYPDPRGFAAEVEALEIRTIAVTNAPSVFRRSAHLTEKCSFLRTALGFHPELAARRRKELGLFRELATEARYIGEVGLDFTTADETERLLQQEVFRGVLDACAGHGKVLTVHSRGAAEQTIDTIGANFAATVILHWYSGPRWLIERAAAQGFFFSVNTAMVKSKNGRGTIGALPRARVLLESDGPFVKVRGRPAGPPDGAVVVAGLADVWGMEAAEAAELLHRNFRSALDTSDNEPSA